MSSVEEVFVSAVTRCCDKVSATLLLLLWTGGLLLVVVVVVVPADESSICVTEGTVGATAIERTYRIKI